MKRTSTTICVICALLLTSLTNAYAQSAPENTSSNASDFTFIVEGMFCDGRLVQMPHGYSLSIRDGKLNAYIPLFCSEEYQMLYSSKSHGLVLKDEPVSVTTEDKKGVHMVYFSVRDDVQKYRITLSYSDPDSADLFVRGQNIYAEFQGSVTALK